MKRLLPALCAILLATGPALAQETGVIEGSVVEPDTRAPVAGATVTAEGTDAEAITDSVGNYRLELPPGSYTLIIDAGEDYEQESVSGVEVGAGQTVSQTLELERLATEDVAEYGEYSVEAGFLEGTTGAVLSQQREALSVTEVIGSAQIARAGDADAAEALTRVTGLTIEQGKYTQVRGQPARYSTTLFNGSPLPSPDPIRQSTPLDLFPTGVLSSISVRKAYSADLPGSFGSGLVALGSRGIPEQTFAEISVSSGINTESTGQDGRDYEGGDEDFLGNDDGTREIPGSIQSVINQGPDALGNLTQAERNELAMDFEPNYAVSTETLPPDAGLTVTGGKRWDTSDSGTYGFLGALSWSNSWRQEEELDRLLDSGGNIEEDFDEERTDFNAGLSTLLVFGADWGNHKLTLNNFFVRDTQQTTQLAEGFDDTSDGRTFRNFTLEWNQRELTLNQLLGSHDFDVVKLDWNAQVADAERDNPDRREYSFLQLNDGSFEFFDEQGLTRRYNETSDDIESFGVDLTIPVLDRESFKLNTRVGASTYSQDRESETNTFLFRPVGGEADLTADVEEIFAPENFGESVDFIDTTQGSDTYDATADVDGAYVSVDATWPDFLRVVAGVREETADYEVTTLSGDNEVVSGFDETDTLPSLNVIYIINRKMQLKVGASRTVSRPLLVELSDTTFFDPDNGDRFEGNPDLKPAKIDHFDLRWEWYPSSSETLNAGIFVKEYDDPIELNFIPLSGGGFEREFINADGATVEGIEVGGRKGGLGFLPEAINWGNWLRDGFIQANLALLDSEVDIDPDTGATNTDRPLQGQADSVLNFQLGFIGGEHEWVVSLNRVGDQLSEAGNDGEDDIIRQAVTTLDASWSWDIARRHSLKVTGRNLTDPTIEFRQDGKLEGEETFGTTVKVSYKYEFF